LNAPGREQHDPWAGQAREFGDCSQMASESQILTPPSNEQRHAPRRRLCGDLRLIIARVEIKRFVPELEAALRKNSQGRNDQLE